MSTTKKLVFTALCTALGVVLPLAFHAVANAGSIFLPMHVPVLLCGLLCGWPYGLACGALAPLLSSLFTGMPPAAILPGMLFELSVYGAVSGAMLRRVRTGNSAADIYIALLTAMLCGRVTSGILNALVFRAGAYSLQIWLTAAFVTGVPGIVVQLVMIPVLMLALERAHVIPGRYCAADKSF